MVEHTESRILPFDAEVLFDLVADVERYPEFVPFWKEARISRRESDEVYYTEQVIGKGPVHERFRSKTVLERPHRIDVTASEEAFRHFDIHWRFDPAGKGSCHVFVRLVAEARSPLLQRVLDTMLINAPRNIVRAFEDRAHRLSKVLR